MLYGCDKTGRKAHREARSEEAQAVTVPQCRTRDVMCSAAHQDASSSSVTILNP